MRCAISLFKNASNFKSSPKLQARIRFSFRAPNSTIADCDENAMNRITVDDREPCSGLSTFHEDDDSDSARDYDDGLNSDEVTRIETT